jgi:hypothetical protein
VAPLRKSIDEFGDELAFSLAVENAIADKLEAGELCGASTQVNDEVLDTKGEFELQPRSREPSTTWSRSTNGQSE